MSDGSLNDGSLNEGSMGERSLSERVAELRQRIVALEQRIEAAGGSTEQTKILAVTKTFDIEVCRLAVAAGLVELGENYAQELQQKAPQMVDSLSQRSVTWHFIGALQRNKVKKIAPYVGLWQTVDRDSVATEIAKRAPGAAVLVQVNVTDEPQKAGVAPGETEALVDHCRSQGLDVRGLMTIGPTDGSDPSRGFAQLRELGERLQLVELSMGMTADIEQAVAEGSTMIRVGTALFGPRSRTVVRSDI